MAMEGTAHLALIQLFRKQRVASTNLCLPIFTVYKLNKLDMSESWGEEKNWRDDSVEE